VCGHMALDEQGATSGVEPGGEQQGGGSPRPLGKALRLVRHRHPVEVDDAVDGVVLVLLGDPLPHRTEIVAQVHLAGGLDAGEDSGHGEQGSRGSYGFSGTFACVPYAVSTPVFEGPFDLLLHLILRQEVDLWEVSLAAIVDEYLREVEHMESLDLEVATEFL